MEPVEPALKVLTPEAYRALLAQKLRGDPAYLKSLVRWMLKHDPALRDIIAKGKRDAAAEPGERGRAAGRLDQR